jgi:hypothetical protein
VIIEKIKTAAFLKTTVYVSYVFTAIAANNKLII